MIVAVLGSSLLALAIGWVLGMWTRKRSDRWCAVDGSKLVCVRCITTGAHSLGGLANLARHSSTVEDAS
jgi:hypothetical protein